MSVVHLAQRRSEELVGRAKLTNMVRELKQYIKDTETQAQLDGHAVGKNTDDRKLNLQRHLLSLPHYTQAVASLSDAQGDLSHAEAKCDGLSGELWATIADLNAAQRDEVGGGNPF